MVVTGTVGIPIPRQTRATCPVNKNDIKSPGSKGWGFNLNGETEMQIKAGGSNEPPAPFLRIDGKNTQDQE